MVYTNFKIGGIPSSNFKPPIQLALNFVFVLGRNQISAWPLKVRM